MCVEFYSPKRFKKFLFSRILNFTRTEIHRLDPLSVLLDPPLQGAWGAWLNALHYFGVLPMHRVSWDFSGGLSGVGRFIVQ